MYVGSAQFEFCQAVTCILVGAQFESCQAVEFILEVPRLNLVRQ
jgi:hypothetical protein